MKDGPRRAAAAALESSNYLHIMKKYFFVLFLRPEESP